MTNSKPWPAVINTNNNVLLASSTLTATKKTVATANVSTSFAVKQSVMLKRYSFDDNGGGYRGL